MAVRRARWLAILGHASFTVLCHPSCFVPICICSAAFHVEMAEASRKHGNAAEKKTFFVQIIRVRIRAEDYL